MPPAKKAKPGEAAEAVAQAIDLRPLEWAEIEVPIVGLAPLIINKWTEKAKKMMLDKQQGKPAQKKNRRIPRRTPRIPPTGCRDIFRRSSPRLSRPQPQKLRASTTKRLLAAG